MSSVANNGESCIRPCVLTVAGSDSGGNAGVQADLRAFHAFGLHGCTVFTALTAQNPFGVSAVHDVPPDFIAAQLDAVLGVYAIKAMKTGMLSTPEAIEVVAGRMAHHGEIAKVIDPVMIATSGAKLLRDDAVDALKSRLLPLATGATPNIPEAEVLSGRAIRTRQDMQDAALALSDMIGAAVLVKGGHFADDADAEDVLWDGREFHSFGAARIVDPVSTHGTGCTFAAAFAAALARGEGLSAAAKTAKDHVYNAIRLSYYVGVRCGVLGSPIPVQTA